MRKLIWIIPVGYIALVGQQILRSFVKIERLRLDSEIKVKEKEGLKKDIANYDELLSNMNDSFYREKIARDKLQMILPGEKIYRLIEE